MFKIRGGEYAFSSFILVSLAPVQITFSRCTDNFSENGTEGNFRQRWTYTHGLRETTGLVLTTYPREILGSGFNFRRFFPRRILRKPRTKAWANIQHVYAPVGKCLSSSLVNEHVFREGKRRAVLISLMQQDYCHEIIMTNLKIATKFKCTLKFIMLHI